MAAVDELKKLLDVLLMPEEQLKPLIDAAVSQLEAGEKLTGPLKDILTSKAKGSIKAGVTAAGMEQKLRGELEKLKTRSGLTLSAVREKPILQAQGEVAAAKVRATPILAGIEKAEKRIRGMIKEPKFSVERVRGFINKLPTETHPEAIFTQGTLTDLLETEVAKRQAETRANLNEHKITSGEAVTRAEKLTAETAEVFPRDVRARQRLTPTGRQAFQEVIALEESSRMRAQFLLQAENPLQKAGLKLGPGEAIQRLQEPMLGKQAGLPQATSQFQALLAKAEGSAGVATEGGAPKGPRVQPQLKAAVAGIPGALGEAGKGLSKYKGKAAGIAGIAALLPLLMKMFGGGQEQGQMPMPMQIQMLQQMAQMQQQQQGAQSLSTSREASAAKNLAQADLIRLQMMQLAGGPSPAVV